MNTRPTEKQAETLCHIRQFIAENGYSPTVGELATIAGVRGNAVQERIDALVKKGFVTRAPRMGRTLRPVADS